MLLQSELLQQRFRSDLAEVGNVIQQVRQKNFEKNEQLISEQVELRTALNDERERQERILDTLKRQLSNLSEISDPPSIGVSLSDAYLSPPVSGHGSLPPAASPSSVSSTAQLSLDVSKLRAEMELMQYETDALLREKETWLAEKRDLELKLASATANSALSHSCPDAYTTHAPLPPPTTAPPHTEHPLPSPSNNSDSHHDGNNNSGTHAPLSPRGGGGGSSSASPAVPLPVIIAGPASGEGSTACNTLSAIASGSWDSDSSASSTPVGRAVAGSHRSNGASWDNDDDSSAGSTPVTCVRVVGDRWGCDVSEDEGGDPPLLPTVTFSRVSAFTGSLVPSTSGAASASSKGLLGGNLKFSRCGVGRTNSPKHTTASGASCGRRVCASEPKQPLSLLGPSHRTQNDTISDLEAKNAFLQSEIQRLQETISSLPSISEKEKLLSKISTLELAHHSLLSKEVERMRELHANIQREVRFQENNDNCELVAKIKSLELELIEAKERETVQHACLTELKSTVDRLQALEKEFFAAAAATVTEAKRADCHQTQDSAKLKATILILEAEARQRDAAQRECVEELRQTISRLEAAQQELILAASASKPESIVSVAVQQECAEELRATILRLEAAQQQLILAASAAEAESKQRDSLQRECTEKLRDTISRLEAAQQQLILAACAAEEESKHRDAIHQERENELLATISRLEASQPQLSLSVSAAERQSLEFDECLVSVSQQLPKLEQVQSLLRIEKEHFQKELEETRRRVDSLRTERDMLANALSAAFNGLLSLRSWVDSLTTRIIEGGKTGRELRREMLEVICASRASASLAAPALLSGSSDLRCANCKDMESEIVALHARLTSNKAKRAEAEDSLGRLEFKCAHQYTLYTKHLERLSTRISELETRSPSS